MTNIYVIGTGIFSSLHLTHEAIQAAKACSKIYVLHQDESMVEELKKYCANVFDLHEYYANAAPGAKRTDIYDSISRAVISDSKAEGGSIGLAVHGNPMFLVSAVENIIKESRRDGLTVSIIPGVSSFDTIQCDLGLDLGYGVQLFDCTTLVNSEFNIEPKLPSLIFQLSTFRNPNVVTGNIENSSLSSLVSYLEKYYPANHECSIVLSRASLFERAEVIKLRLCDLVKSREYSLEHRPTLYIPEVVNAN